MSELDLYTESDVDFLINYYEDLVIGQNIQGYPIIRILYKEHVKDNLFQITGRTRMDEFKMPVSMGFHIRELAMKLHLLSPKDALNSRL